MSTRNHQPRTSPNSAPGHDAHPFDPESARLHAEVSRQGDWKRWGPYLSERQWGTVREDYSADGDCWNSLTHDHARSRAYRWGEDGLLGICDRQCRLCFALALWNERDPILKERLFGLVNTEGNHGEDVKECYYFLDATPTSSYLRALYKYAQAEFPYGRLVEENRRRGPHEREFELADTGVFNDGRFFDVDVEYAKQAPEDLLIRVTIANRGPAPANLHVLPTLWFRNTWSWGRDGEDHSMGARPILAACGDDLVRADHPTLGRFELHIEPGPDGAAPELLFTENETNTARLFGVSNPARHVKDAFHDRVVRGRTDAVNPDRTGTKCAVWHRLVVPAGGEMVLRMRLTRVDGADGTSLSRAAGEGTSHAGASARLDPASFDAAVAQRLGEADAFYACRFGSRLDEEEQRVARQASAGLLWSKQFYHYAVRDWIDGDPAQPAPPPQRREGRNAEWGHLYNRDVLSMPDTWEYPWYAAWDLAFHMVAMARIDAEFAKDQLLLLLREWYMHPNGQLPAYEFALGDVNPPVHAWACWRVYKMAAPRGKRDRVFLARAFQKLLLNFTWWVNRKDLEGKHVFAGGFLGLDNIGVFDRSRPLPTGGHLEQADGTAWMAFYCLTMLAMALELASEDPSYEDVASKFFEHFTAIADAMNTLGGTGLWDEHDGFYYDQLHVECGCGTDVHQPLRVRSMVGLLPLIAVEVLEDDVLEKLPAFAKRLRWFLRHRSDLAKQVAYFETVHDGGERHAHHLLALPARHRLERLLGYLFDEEEFLAPHGLRSVSRVHRDKPYVFSADGQEFTVRYEPGESTSGIFGGNSNWRGPIWFPVNYLIIEALERYHHVYGDDLLVEFPARSGRRINLAQAADELRRRMASLFVPGADGARPCHGSDRRYVDDPAWRDLVLFHEYFDGDTGRGLGASHQTGWTALIIPCLVDLGRARGTGMGAGHEHTATSPHVGLATPSEPRAQARGPTPRVHINRAAK